MATQTFAELMRPGRRSPDPVSLYLDQLSPGSRRVMRASLVLIADTLSRGQFSAADFPWSRATYADAARLRSWLQKTYAPATVARHLCAWRCVLREAWRLGELSTDSYQRARDVRAPKKERRTLAVCCAPTRSPPFSPSKTPRRGTFGTPPWSRCWRDAGCAGPSWPTWPLTTLTLLAGACRAMRQGGTSPRPHGPLAAPPIRPAMGGSQGDPGAAPSSVQLGIRAGCSSAVSRRPP